MSYILQERVEFYCFNWVVTHVGMKWGQRGESVKRKIKLGFLCIAIRSMSVVCLRRQWQRQVSTHELRLFPFSLPYCTQHSHSDNSQCERVRRSSHFAEDYEPSMRNLLACRENKQHCSMFFEIPICSCSYFIYLLD